MKELSRNTITNQYIKSGVIGYETTLNGDYKKGNKEYTKIKKVYQYLEKNIDVAKQVLPSLFNYENVEVRSIVSAHCLALGIFIKEAEEILNSIANDKKNGIFSFNAEMTLKVWKEGKISIYRK